VPAGGVQPSGPATNKEVNIVINIPSNESRLADEDEDRLFKFLWEWLSPNPDESIAAIVRLEESARSNARFEMLLICLKQILDHALEVHIA
jgi:hypothetical protein